MRHLSPLMRSIAVLILALWFSSVASLSAVAQDDGTPSAEETPTEGEAPLQGTLSFLVYSCTNGPEGIAGDLFLEGEFTPDENCTEGGTASVSIDNSDAQDAASGAEFLLDEGDHSVVEVNLGESADVTIAADTPVVVTIVFYETSEAPGGEAGTGSILITKHVCPESIQSQQEFDELGDFYAKIQECLAITLPGDDGPQGAVNGNEDEQPLSFDFEVADGTTAQAIDAATFTPEQLCESDLGQDINNDPNDNLCLDTSHYDYAGVIQGAVTIAEVAPPDGFAFGAIEFSPESGDDASLVSTSTDEGIINLDTTDDDSVVVHIFNFQKPPENQITIVKHQCKNISNVDDFDAIGDFYDKWQECPVITRTGNDGPDGAVDGGHGSFDFDVAGADSQKQTIADATFISEQLCESDLGQDINNDPNDDLCLSSSGYQFQNVLQGTGVTVTETKAPTGYRFGAVEFDPASGDDASLVSASDDGVIELDTTDDGGVILHIFNIKNPVEPTPSPTSTPSPTPTSVPSPYGSVQVLSFECTGDVEETIINVLPPGEDATESDFGDSSCAKAAADFSIKLFGTETLVESFSTNADGQVTLIHVPKTDSTTGSHIITETFSAVSAEFDIDPDTVTHIIVLNYLIVEDQDTDATDDAIDDAVVDDSDDEESIDSGEDLADTGMGSYYGPVDSGMVLMLGSMSLLLLAGATLLKRRSG